VREEPAEKYGLFAAANGIAGDSVDH